MIMRKICKQVISGILAALLCFAVFPVMGAEEDAVTLRYDAAESLNRVELLKALGVLDYDVTEENLGQTVTRVQLYGAIIGLLGELNDHIHYNIYSFSDIKELPEGDKIQLACALGWVAPAYRFEAQSPASAEEGIRLLMNLLGYREILADLGDSALMSQANQVGLLRGVKLSVGDTLRWEELLMLMENALDTEVMYLIGYDAGRGTTLRRLNGETLSSVYLDVVSVIDVVRANPLTSITDGGNAGPGRVQVGDISMNIGDSNAAALLGYEAKVYARVENNVYTVLYAEATPENRCWNIPAEDLMKTDGAWSAFQIVYMDGNGRRKRTLQLPTNVAVIYNGVQLYEYTAADLAISQGSLTVIDNDRDGRPDVVLADEFVNYIADAFSVGDQILYSKNMPPLDLGNPDADVEILSVLGEPYDYGQITEGAILSLNVSRDGAYIHGVVVKDKKSGTLTSVQKRDGRLYIGIDGYEYPVSPAWDETVYDGKPENLKVGSRYMIYLDKLSQVAAVMQRSSGTTYAFMYGGRISGTFGYNANLLLYTDSAVWEQATLANRVRVNGELLTSDQVIKSAAVFQDGKPIQQMVKVTLDDDNQITQLYTPMEKETVENSETLTKEEALVNGGSHTGTYRTSGNNFNYFEYTLAGSIIFNLPKDDEGSYERDYFSVIPISKFYNDRSYTLSFYDVSETKTPKVAVLESRISQTSNWTSYAVYVKSTMNVMQEDGSIAKALDCFNQGADVIYTAMEDSMIEDVRAGDVLVLYINTDGKIGDKAVKIYDAAGFEAGEKTNILAAAGIEGVKDTSQNTYSGTVEKKDGNNILINTGVNTRVVPLTAPKYLTICDPDAADPDLMFRKATAAEVPVGARVILYTRYGIAYDLIVFE